MQAESGKPTLVLGVHATVPGPQYETAAELAALQAMGATTVSMSGAAEIRAARGDGLETALLCIVTNIGDTSHEEVLQKSASAEEPLAAAVATVLDAWESRARPGSMRKVP